MSGSVAIAGLSPCYACRPVSPSQYALAALLPDDEYRPNCAVPRHARRRTCQCYSIHLLSSCEKGSTNSLVKRDPEEVCPLSRGMFFNPYPPHYRMAFAFSSFLYPHCHRRSLRFACRSVRRQYGLTMFHTRYMNRLDPAFSPVIFLSLCPYHANEQPITHLLVQACQHLWLVKFHEVYQQFT